VKGIAGMRRQVGWFVIIGVGAIILILLITSLRTDVFAKKFHLTFSPPSAAAFHVGQPVKFQGFTIGRVGDMELLAAGKVQITLRLLERYRNMVHQNGVARIVKEGLIGEQVVEVTAGDDQKPVIRDGQALQYESEASIEQLLQDMKPAVANANTLLREAAELTTWLNDPYGGVRQVVAKLGDVSKGMSRENIEALMQGFAKTLASMQSIVAEFDQQHVGKNLSHSLKMTTKILNDIQPLSQALGEKGPESFERINSMLVHVDQLSKSLDVVASDLSELTPELPGLARESRGTIHEMQGLLKGLRGSWLFGGEDSEQSKEPLATPVLDMRP